MKLVLRWQQIGMVLGYAGIMAVGQLVLAAAAKEIPFGKGLQQSVAGAMSSGWLWAGIALYVAATALWLFILSVVPLRYAYPIAALSIAFAPLFFGIVTGDYPAARYWFGLSLILGGVALVTSER